MRFLLTTALFIALTTAAQAQRLSPRVEQMLKYLPPQSETLSVAQKPFDIPPEDGRKSEMPPDEATYGLPTNLASSAVVPALSGRTIELSMEARSNFRPPRGLGLMLYDGSGILLLKPQPGQTREELKNLVWKNAERITLAGQEVGVFEEKRNSSLWSIYIAVPRPDMIVTATDRASMITTLARMQRPALSDRAIPSSWSGWKLVDTKAPFWAVRRLDLPESTGIFGPRQRDSKARALVIYQRVTPDEKSDWIVKCDGNPKRVRQLFEKIQSEVKGKVSQPEGSDITQFTVSKPDGYFTYHALNLLGTSIYL